VKYSPIVGQNPLKVKENQEKRREAKYQNHSEKDRLGTTKSQGSVRGHREKQENGDQG